MSELDVQLAGKSLADYTNTQLRLALGAVLYTNTADMWKRYLNQLGYSGDVSQMLQKYYIDYSVPSNFRNYINAGAFIYSPQQLFVDGSKGVIFDNADLSSFYLDSAGVTAATVNGLVGLQLDKSANLALGAELFDAPSSTESAGVVQQGTSNDYFLTAAAASTGAIAYNAGMTARAGKWFAITYEIYDYVSGSVAARVQGLDKTTRSSNGIFTEYHLAAGVADFVGVSTISTSTLKIRNYSVKELPGNHRYQTTTGSKPVLRGTPTGANLVTNGDFASGTTTGWTGNSATLSVVSGKIRVTATGAGFCSGYQVISGLTPSGWYRLRGTCQKISGASVAYMRFYDTTPTTTPVAGPFFSSTSALVSGEAYFQASADGTITLNLSIESSAGAGETADFDDITLHDVSAGQVTAPYGLQYDGVDDFMQTAAVDFTATDKMFVCAGVRKLSDSAQGVVASLGSVATTAGTFEINAPSGVGLANYAMQLKGATTLSTYLFTTYASPVTNVISFAMDYAAATGSEVIARVNGATPTISAGVESGVGPFANQIMYFGRRTGTALPLNGLDFGMVICGKTLTSTQISSTERYIAQRTGIAL